MCGANNFFSKQSNSMMVGLKVSDLLTEILYVKENESGSIELRSLLLSQGSKTSDFQVVLTHSLLEILPKNAF